MDLLQIFLAFAAQVEKAFNEKNAEIAQLKEERAADKEKLAIALSNDASDAATIAQAQAEAQAVKDELEAYKASVESGEQNQQLKLAITDLATKLNLTLPTPESEEELPATA